MSFERTLYRVRPAFLASWLKTAFGVRRRVAPTKEGLKFFVDPVSHLGREILETGTYEPDIVDILRALLRPGDVFFDAGANEGFFVCLAAQIVGPRGRVVGAEPQERLLPVVRENVVLNGFTRVEVLPVALSDRNGQETFYYTPDTNSGGSGFFRLTRGSQTRTVPAITLDPAWDRLALDRVRFLKVDVEGAEGKLLAGAGRVLAEKRIDFVMVELHPHLTGPETPCELGAALKRAGYQLLQVANGGWIYHLPELADQLSPLGPCVPPTGPFA